MNRYFYCVAHFVGNEIDAGVLEEFYGRCPKSIDRLFPEDDYVIEIPDGGSNGVV